MGALTGAWGSLSDKVPLRHTLFDGVGGIGEPVWHARRPRPGQNIMLKPTLTAAWNVTVRERETSQEVSHSARCVTVREPPSA